MEERSLRKKEIYLSFQGLHPVDRLVLDHIVDKIWPVLEDSVTSELLKIRVSSLNSRFLAPKRSGHSLWHTFRNRYTHLSIATRKAYYVVLAASYGGEGSTSAWFQAFRRHNAGFVADVDAKNGPLGCAAVLEQMGKQDCVLHTTHHDAKQHASAVSSDVTLNATFDHIFAPIDEPTLKAAETKVRTPRATRRASGRHDSPIPLASSPLPAADEKQGASPDCRQSMGAVSLHFFTQVSELEAENRELRSQNFDLKNQVEQYQNLYARIQGNFLELHNIGAAGPGDRDF